jgi:long-chain acyl-CoA synthetase
LDGMDRKTAGSEARVKSAEDGCTEETMNVGRVAFDGRRADRDLTLLECGGKSLTEFAFESLVGDWRRALEGVGLARGKCLLVWCENSLPVAAAYFAAWDIGAVVVPVNPSVPYEGVVRIGQETEAAVWVVEPAAASGLVDDPDRWPRVCITTGPDGTPRVARLGEPSGSAPPQVDAVAPAVILYTSGTTGAAKGICLSHHDLIRSLDSLLGYAGQSQVAPTRGAHLCCFPLSHISGLMGLLYGLRARRPVVLLRRFEGREFCSAVQAHGLKYAALTPSMLSDVLRAAGEDRSVLQTLNMVRTLAAPLPESMARRAWEEFGIKTLNSYGLTETAGEVIAWNGKDLAEYFPAKIGSVGRPHPGVDLRLVDPSGAQDVPPGEIGELWVKAPFTFAGYWGGGDVPVRDGYLRTGDLARVDADGFVWLCGRATDAINRGGFKVIPEEVEEVLHAHPAVREAMVVGLPDDRLGSVPAAFVVFEDVDVDASVHETIRSYVSGHVARYKMPAVWYEVSEIPRTSNGKVRRNLAEILIADGRAKALPGTPHALVGTVDGVAAGERRIRGGNDGTSGE